jgi:AcrR family transcriptional regulator
MTSAIELVHQRGERVPMADIARHAGVGVGTLYRHFATRDELLGAIVERSFAIALANADAASSEPGSAVHGVRAFFVATLRDRHRFLLPLHGGPVVFTPAALELQAAVRAALQALIDRGRAAGQLRGDLTPIDLIVAASTLSRPLPNTEDWDTLARRQIELFVSGISPPPGTRT